MATITIRNLDPEVVERIKGQAKSNGRSMEQEVRVILGQQQTTRKERLSKMRSSWSEFTKPPTAKDIDTWLKNSRKGR